MLGYLQKPSVQMALFFVAVAGGGAFFYMQDQQAAQSSPQAAAEGKPPPKGMGQASAETVKVARTDIKSSETAQSVKLDKFYLPPSKPEPPTVVKAPPPKKEEKPKPPQFPNLVQIASTARPPVFRAKEPTIFAPRGTLIKVALVITLESNAIGTPVLGMVIEDVYFQGNLIVPAGTQVQAMAFANSRFRDRIDVRGSFTFVWTDGSEYVINGVALDHQPLSDGTFSLTDGSPGIRGRILKTDEYAELKLLVAEALQGVMNNSQTQFQSVYGLVPENTNRNAALGGGSSGAQAYAGLLSKKIEKDLEYVQVPAGTSFYLYTTDVFEPELRSVAGIRQGNQPLTGVQEQQSMHQAVSAQFSMREEEAKAKLEDARSAAAATEKAKEQKERLDRTKALFGPAKGTDSGGSSSSSPSSASPTTSSRQFSEEELRVGRMFGMSESQMAAAAPYAGQTMTQEQVVSRGIMTQDQVDQEFSSLRSKMNEFKRETK